MKALVISALAADAEHGAAAQWALAAALAEHGYEVDLVDCLDVRVIPCTGCSGCGLKTPGACAVQDDMQGIYRRMVASDVLVLATPVRFGSYCAELKKVVDRFQPLMVPIYVLRDGEMHFQSRYDLPPLVGVGLVRENGDDGKHDGSDGRRDGQDDEAAAFRFLIGRLAVNVATRHAATTVAAGDEPRLREALAAVLDDLTEVAR